MPTSPDTNPGPDQPIHVAGATHQAIYRRFRAQTFDQMVGQRAVVETLRNAVRMDRLSHGLLFVGPRGTGKTSMARILAKAVNCTDLRDGEPCDRCPSCVAIREGRALDVIELDAASNNRVDDMRELVPRVYTTAADLRRKVFIIDEVQRIKEGWDVLLKTLEEPPDGVLFVFCTTDPSQIRPAVVSRLQRFTFRPLSTDEIRGKLTRILESEGRIADDQALELIARLAAGGMRDAESLLDQVLAMSDETIDADRVRDLLGLAQETAIERFVDALASGDALAGIDVLDHLEAEGRDLVSFSEQVVVHLRERLVASMTSRDTTGTPALAAAARRLVGIDASRSGLGGYRWQLELALFAASPAPGPTRDPVDGARSSALRTAPSVSLPASPPPSTAGQPPTPSKATTAAQPSTPSKASTAAQPTAAQPATPSTTEAASAPRAPSAGSAPRAPSAGSDPPLPRRSEAPVLPPPSPVSHSADASTDLLTDLRARWPEIVAWVARNPANRPLIENCRPVEVRDGVVILGFPENQPFLREKAEHRRSALEDGFAHVLGRPVRVRCVVANIELATTEPDDGIDLLAQARKVFGGDLTDVGDIG